MRRAPGALAALACVLPLLVLVLLFVPRTPEPAYYGVARLAQAASAIAVIAPVCAALAALEGARLRRGGVAALAPVRGELAVAARSLWPTFTLGLVAVAAAVALMLADGPRLEPDDFVVLLIPVAVLAGHVSLGYLAGRAMTAVLAVPLVLAASWLWLVYPIALEPLWVRHLSGYPASCCDIAATPAAGAVAAPIVLAVAAVVVTAVMLARLPLAGRGAVAALVLGGAAVLAVSLVDGLGSEPEVARPAGDLRCSGEAPRVCVWPEHAAVASLVESESRAMRERLAAAGVPTPDTVSEARSAAGRDWFIGTHPDAGRDEVDVTLVEGLLPAFPDCASSAPYPAYEAYWPVALWLGRRAGVSADVLARSTSDSDRRQVAAVERLAPEAQLDWFTTNMHALAGCTAGPELLASR